MSGRLFAQTAGFSFLGGANLRLQGVAEARVRLVSAGSDFRNLEFSGRRRPARNLSDVVAAYKEKQLSQGRIPRCEA